MGGRGNHVKQLLASARHYHRPELLDDVLDAVRATERKAGATAAELRVLSAEVAVELQQWAIASQLLYGIGDAHATRLLRIRKVICDALVTVHAADAQDFLSEDEKMERRLGAAATVLQVLADSVELWPESLEAVLKGTHALWSVLQPLYGAGRYAEICDAVIFLTHLHRQLQIGGGYLLVQWSVRAAACLHASDRAAESVAHYHTALEAASLLSNQRLYIQLLRMAAGTIYAREKAAVSSKGRPELLGAFRGRPAVFAAVLSQLLLRCAIEIDTCREDLHASFEALSGRAAEAPPPVESTSSSKQKKKPASAKQTPSAKVVEGFAITDIDVVEEVMSDLLLAIAIHDTLTTQEEEELVKTARSNNHRVRSFATYAQVIQEGRASGVAQLVTAADASSLLPAHQVMLKTFTKRLVSVVKSTNAIPDKSERQYTLNVGVVILWRCLLPFLQPQFVTAVQGALDVVLDVSQSALPQLRELFLQVALQQCHVALDEDQRSTLQLLLPALELECKRCPSRPVEHYVEFPLKWMERQLRVLGEPEEDGMTEEDRCLLSLEQARVVSNPRKRIPLLKTAFQHLPTLLHTSDGRPSTPTAAGTPRVSPAQGGIEAPVQLRSAIQLYKDLLEQCMEELSPSLYAVAGSVADALRTLPRPPPPGSAVEEIEELQAVASLHAATIQLRQVEEAQPPTDATTAATGDGQSACKEAESKLVTLLREAAQRGNELELRRSGCGAWIVANACLTFLAWKKGVYAGGHCAAHVSELLELHGLYASLFAKGKQQDVVLLSDLAVAAVVAILDVYTTSKLPADITINQSNGNAVDTDGYAALLVRVYACTGSESSNQQLRKAETLSRDVLHHIREPRQKWFLTMLYPTLLRLLNEKPSAAAHPQEQLLLHLGAVGPLLATSDGSASEIFGVLEQEMRPLLRKDPSVRLCAWVAAVAAAARHEDAVLECCRIADRLYASGRLGWNSVYDTLSAGAINGVAGASPGAGGSSGKGTESVPTSVGTMTASAKKGNTMHGTDVLDGTTAATPSREDWQAYAELLAMKTHLCATHLQGLTGTMRRTALEQLFVNCVNGAIAAVHGPAAGRARGVVNAFASYYTMLRDNDVPLGEAAFLLPSLRMLLSQPLLMQVPRRDWNDDFTEVVYQLGCILVYVSYNAGREDDRARLGAHVQVVRDCLPPRFQKALKLRETTELCYCDPTVASFLQASRNMEKELQMRGWLIVSQLASTDSCAEEAFAFALGGTQGNAMARSQCLFEYAHAALLRGGTSVTALLDTLREALRVLEGLPDTLPLLYDGAGDVAALAGLSSTATFLKTLAPHFTSTERDVHSAASTKRGTASHRSATKKVPAASKTATVGFSHVFLGLRIVSLLSRLSPAESQSTSSILGSPSAPPTQRGMTLNTRANCANTMVDYVWCLWNLCARVLEEAEEFAAAGSSATSADAAEGSDTVLHLPTSSCNFYGFTASSKISARLNLLIEDEEWQLNSESLWWCLLELADYLVRSGDEEHAFMIYAWIHLSVEVSRGTAELDVPCAIVQRLCTLKMCVASAASGLSDLPYAGSSATEVQGVSTGAAQHLPTWVLDFAVAEAEALVQVGSIEEAADIAARLLIRDGDSHEDHTSRECTLRGQCVLAQFDVLRRRHGDALEKVDAALAAFEVHMPLTVAVTTGPSAATWVRLCGAKLHTLLSSQALASAVTWAATVRQQLETWQSLTGTANAADGSQSACLRADIADAVEYWVRELLCHASSIQPSLMGLQLFPSSDAQLATTSLGLLREVVALTGSAETLQGKLHCAAAQWYLHKPITAAWVAKHGNSVDEHIRPALEKLQEEMETLVVLSRRLDASLPAPVETVEVAAVSKSFTPYASRRRLWQSFLLYWTALCRHEASRLIGCLVSSFRHLSLAELNMPTTSAPAHLEQEVLRFLRGVTKDTPLLTPTEAEGEQPTVTETATLKVGERWQKVSEEALTEVQQALRYFKLPPEYASHLAGLMTVAPLLLQARTLSQPWAHLSLAGKIVAALAEVEVQRLTENEITVGEEMVGARLEAERENVLTTAWNASLLTNVPTEKTTGRVRRSLNATKRKDTSEAIQDDATGMHVLSAAQEDLLARIYVAIREALRSLNADVATQLCDHLGDLATLLKRPRLAAAALEQQQACQLLPFVAARAVHSMADCVESRLWRQLACVDPVLRGTTACATLLEKALGSSPMGRALRSCAILCAREENPNERVPLPQLTPYAKEVVGADASPFTSDGPVLTITMSAVHDDCCYVVLRHPDGGVDGRRRSLTATEWAALYAQVQQSEREAMSWLEAVSTGSRGQNNSEDGDAASVTALSQLTAALLAEFIPILQLYWSKAQLYLCVSPSLQPLPWEQTATLAACPIVLREVTAAVVVLPRLEAGTTMKGPFTSVVKQTGLSSNKVAPLSVPLCLVDVFGDHPASVQALLAVESNKQKATQQTVLTSSATGIAPDPAYVTWMLQSTAPSALVVDTCGSLTDAVPWSYLSMLSLGQLSAVVLADGAVNATSRQRDERSHMGTPGYAVSASEGTTPRWMTQLLLHLRGAKCVVASSVPCEPGAADQLARRCLASISAGKSLVEQLKGRSKEAKMPPITLYGSLAVSGKQKV